MTTKLVVSLECKGVVCGVAVSLKCGGVVLLKWMVCALRCEGVCEDVVRECEKV
jgi:hypothetical protein